MRLFLYLYSIKCKKQRNIFKYKNNVQPFKIQIPLNGTRILHYCMPPPGVRDHCRRGGERVLRAGGGQHKETNRAFQTQPSGCCGYNSMCKTCSGSSLDCSMQGGGHDVSPPAANYSASVVGHIARNIQAAPIGLVHTQWGRQGIIGLGGVGVGTHMIQKPLHEILKEPIKI